MATLMRSVFTRSSILVVSALVALSSDVVAQDSTAPRECVRPGEPAESLNVTSALDREREARAIARAGARVRRAGDTLFLPSARNGRDAYVDCTRSWDRYVRYVFESTGPRAQGFLTFVSMGESWNYFWLDDQRDTVHILHSRPDFSPDSSTFIVANSDLDAEYTPNVLEVWRVSGSSLQQEFRLFGGRYGFEFLRFESDTLAALYVTRMREDHSTDSLPAHLVRRSAGWSLHLVAREP